MVLSLRLAFVAVFCARVSLPRTQLSRSQRPPWCMRGTCWTASQTEARAGDGDLGRGRIVSVQTGLVGAPSGAEVIELGDATLLPGLIDAHKHMGGGPRLTMNVFQERLTISLLEDAIGSALQARKLLEEGFTTVRNMGSSDGGNLALKRSIDRG